LTSFESKSSAISLSTKLWGCYQQIKEVESHGVDRINHFAMVGPQASELSAEGTLALEMGSTLEDLLVTIHPPPPHPTLLEAFMEAAEVAAGCPVHIPPAEKK
jgi:hypothetical protein